MCRFKSIKKWNAIHQYDRMANNKNSMTFASSRGLVSKVWHLFCLFCNTKKRGQKVEMFCKQYQAIECDTAAKLALYLRIAKFKDASKIHLFNKHWYDETIILPFHDLEMPCPKEYDAVLRLMYGDTYMTPIRQSSYHGEVVLDIDRPYQDVVKELLSKKAWWKRFWYKY